MMGAAISLRKRRALQGCVQTALIALALVSLPFLVDLANRGIDWISDFLSGFQKPWEALLWVR
jgi:hypothetical protein